MIDGIKITYCCLRITEILASLGVEFGEHKIGRGGVLKWSKAKHKHLNFCVFPTSRVIITGSLQKYWKGENYSDFTFTELCECINDICQRFQIPPNASLQNVEWGVNIQTPFSPFEFCSNVIAFWDGARLFNEMDDCEPVIGFECTRTEFRVKIYDKGLQNHLDANILRFEIAANKMRAVASTDIKTVSDLTKRAKIALLGDLLNEKFAELIIGDSVTRSALSKQELEIYEQGSNPKEWGKMPRWERVRIKPAFRQIIELHGKNKWVGLIADKVSEKWNLLLTSNALSANILPEGVGFEQASQSANVLSVLSAPQEKAIYKRSHTFGKQGKRSTLTNYKRHCNGFKRGITLTKPTGKLMSARRNRGPPKCLIKKRAGPSALTHIAGS